MLPLGPTITPLYSLEAAEQEKATILASLPDADLKEVVQRGWHASEAGTVLNLSSCMESLGPAHIKNSGIWVKDQNPRTKTLLQTLAQTLDRNSTLTKLDLGNNDLPDVSFLALAQVLERNTSLTELGLRTVNLYALSFSYLLDRNTTLSKVDLSSNRLRDGDVSLLAQALQRNTNVTELNLREIGRLNDYHGDYQMPLPLGVQALARALKRNTALTTLDLSKNEIGDYGIQVLAQALRRNATLTKLDLSCNRFQNPGMSALAWSLACNTTLLDLNLSSERVAHCGLTYNCIHHGKEVLSLALRHNTALTRLDLTHRDNSNYCSGNHNFPLYIDRSDPSSGCSSCGHYSDADIQDFAEAMESNSTLTELNLPKKRIYSPQGYPHMDKLNAALDRNRQLASTQAQSLLQQGQQLIESGEPQQASTKLVQALRLGIGAAERQAIQAALQQAQQQISQAADLAARTLAFYRDRPAAFQAAAPITPAPVKPSAEAADQHAADRAANPIKRVHPT